MSSTVYFSKATSSDLNQLSLQAKDLLSKITTAEEINWQKDLPIKIHPGAIGNSTYLRPEALRDTISFLQSIEVNPYYIETCMSSENSTGKEKEFVEHGFTDIPYVIADGADGDEHVEVLVQGSKYFSKCLIAKKLAEANQVLVVSHFKGHGMAGFGGAVKMLGIGFASGQGKAVVHSNRDNITSSGEIDWSVAKKSQTIDEYGILDWNPEVVSTGSYFRDRVAAYATAAAKDKHHVYLTFAINMTRDCDCIDEDMQPVYRDLGIFASTDPVAVDKAVLDLLTEREEKIPFVGSEILTASEKLGLGSTTYQLVEV